MIFVYQVVETPRNLEFAFILILIPFLKNLIFRFAAQFRIAHLPELRRPGQELHVQRLRDHLQAQTPCCQPCGICTLSWQQRVQLFSLWRCVRHTKQAVQAQV